MIDFRSWPKTLRAFPRPTYGCPPMIGVGALPLSAPPNELAFRPVPSGEIAKIVPNPAPPAPVTPYRNPSDSSKSPGLPPFPKKGKSPKLAMNW